MAEGGLLYKELGDNKGPILYLFYLLLYKLGGLNYYRLPLFLFSGVVDGISLYFTIKSFLEILKIKLKFNFINIFFIFLFVGIYKSFSIGEYMGAIYSETLGMLFVSISIYLAIKRKNYWSGFIFAFAPFTRLTLLFYSVFLASIIFEYFFNLRIKFFSKLKELFVFLFGFLTSGFLIVFYMIKNDIFSDYIYYNFILNFNYASYVNKSGRILYVLYTSIYEFRIIILLLLLSLFLFVLFTDRKFKYKRITLFLFISSLLATFFGGIFYYHHFIQFVPIVFFVFSYFIFVIEKYRKILLYLFSAILFASFSFSIFTRDHFDDLTQLTKRISTENNNYKYWQIVPYYPEYYISNNKFSPDKYFITFFVSKYFSLNPTEDIANHSDIERGKICNTLFVFINQNKFDYLVSEDYLQSFKDRFGLTQTKSFIQGKSTINLYEPNCFTK